VTRQIIGFRSADDTHEGLHGRVTVSTGLPTKRRKSRAAQQPIGFHTQEATPADASEPTTLGEMDALKALLRGDHEKRKRKQVASSQEPSWCACGHYGLVDYDVVDRACAALSKMQQGGATGASEEPQPKHVRFHGQRAFDLATTAYQIAVTADYVSIQPRGLDGLSSVDIPIAMVGEVVENLQKAAGDT
jgi:hypothetical protein